eukprot:5515331-Amphidinium_carterae.1
MSVQAKRVESQGKSLVHYADIRAHPQGRASKPRSDAMRLGMRPCAKRRNDARGALDGSSCISAVAASGSLDSVSVRFCKAACKGAFCADPSVADQVWPILAK